MGRMIDAGDVKEKATKVSIASPPAALVAEPMKE